MVYTMFLFDKILIFDIKIMRKIIEGKNDTQRQFMKANYNVL